MNETTEESIDVWDLAINELGFRTLNNIRADPPATVEQAIDRHTETLRRSAFAIALAIDRLARAVEERT